VLADLVGERSRACHEDVNGGPGVGRGADRDAIAEDAYCDVAPVQVRVTSRTVAKKVCPVADRVIVPGGGGGGGGGGAGDGWEAWPPR